MASRNFYQSTDERKAKQGESKVKEYRGQTHYLVQVLSGRRGTAGRA